MTSGTGIVYVELMSQQWRRGDEVGGAVRLNMMRKEMTVNFLSKRKRSDTGLLS